jgi:HPt (histidine-containing phosphotransfer) domain-containing protein
MTETDSLLAQINESWQAADIEKLHPFLHQLKGTAGTLGLTQLAAQALALEKAVKHQNTQALAEGLPQLNQLFRHFVAQYPAVLTMDAS